ITVANQVVADAGSNAAVCENSSYTVNDANVNYGNGTYSWSHDGSGSLANETTLTPTYTPDASDAGNIVTLTLTADGNSGCSPAVDQMNITVTNQVVADAGGDITLCESNSYTISDAVVNYGNGVLFWTHNGNGTLINDNTITPTYISSSLDAGNTLVLTLHALGVGSCTQAVDQITINVVKKVVANAGIDGSICVNDSYTINGASIQDGDGTYVWAHNGSGNLSDENTLTPTYNSVNEDAGKTVTLSLSAEGLSDCIQGVDQVEIFVEQQVVVNAGGDATICSNESFTVSEAVVQNGNGTYTWSHNGTGSLTDISMLTPTYTPTSADAGNIVTLTLSANGNASCAVSVDEMNINIENYVVADAGDNATICENGFYTVNDASVTNGNGFYNWSHNGNGTIEDANTLVPTYQPAAEDAGTTVTLTLTAESNAGCDVVTDQLDITVAKMVRISIGSDGRTCESSPYTINGVDVENGNGSYIWSHDGSGILTGVNTLNPVYTPGNQDAAKDVVLNLTAQSNSGCGEVSEQYVLSVDESVSANAGSDDEICGDTYNLNASDNGLWSLVNGPGTVTFSPGADRFDARTTVSDAGEYTFEWKVENGACTESAEVTINFNEKPLIEIISDNNICGLQTDIDVHQSVGGGYWVLENGPAGARLGKNSEFLSNTVLVDEPGIVELTWKGNYNTCSDISSVTIDFKEIPEVYAGGNIDLFDSDEVVTEATLKDGETGLWTIVDGSGIIHDENSPTATLTDLEEGENIFKWTVYNGECENASEVIFTVKESNFPNIITPNGDFRNDVFEIDGIENMGPVKMIVFNRWGHKVYENNNYNNEWDGKDMNGRELQEDTYYYYLNFSDKKVIKSYVLIKR
ncbi:T9SS type B sorting domain-containing protein, partial [Saccharicrinis sp. GN24d3]